MSDPTSRPPRWAVAARDDFYAILNYIAADNPVAAERWTDTIYDKAASLADAPYLGPPLPRHRPARYLTHGVYVIYHTVHENELVIRGVVHGARKLQTKWLRREE